MNMTNIFYNVNEIILDFVKEHGGCVHQQHIEILHPEASRENINYLIRNGHLLQLDNGFLANKQGLEPNFPLIAALSVLCDALNNMDSYSLVNYPPIMHMTTLRGKAFEIVYVERGAEASVHDHITAQDQENAGAVKNFVIPKRIVVVQALEQEHELSIPNMVRLAIMQDDGTMGYFNNMKVQA